MKAACDCRQRIIATSSEYFRIIYLGQTIIIVYLHTERTTATAGGCVVATCPLVRGATSLMVLQLRDPTRRYAARVVSTSAEARRQRERSISAICRRLHSIAGTRRVAWPIAAYSQQQQLPLNLYHFYNGCVSNFFHFFYQRRQSAKN